MSNLTRALAGISILLVGCDRDPTAPEPAPTKSSPPTTSVVQPALSASTASSADPSPSALPNPVASTDAPAAQVTITTDAGLVPAARARRVLHVGDSMVPLVANYLRLAYQADHGIYVAKYVDSSTIQTWVDSHTLDKSVWEYAPDFVVISLGSNELIAPHPEGKVPWIKRLVAETHGKPCLWIGPPAWVEASAFINVLQSSIAPCVFFDSSKLSLRRMKDGRHPDWTAGWHWSSAIWKAIGGVGQVPSGSKPTPVDLSP